MLRDGSLSEKQKKALEVLKKKRKLAEKINKADEEGSFLATSSQKRIWFNERLFNSNSVYNLPLCLRMHGNTDVKAVENAVNSILYRHEILRAVFREVDGDVYQDILPHYDIPIMVEDVEREALNERVSQEIQRNISLEDDIKLRAKLFRITDAECVLVLTVHHIVSDGASIQILLKELQELYNKFVKEERVVLPELPLRFKDFAKWQESSGYDQELSYWKNALSGIPDTMGLPLDFPRQDTRDANSSEIIISLSEGLCEKVRLFSKRNSVSLFMTFQSVFSLLLSRYCDESEVVMGVPVSGRDFPNVENLVGFFVSNVVIRNNLSSDQTFREHLSVSKNVILDALSHRKIPFDVIVRELNPKRTLEYNPIFQVVFNHQRDEKAVMRFDGLSVEPFGQIQDKNIEFDLGLTVFEGRQSISLSFSYNANLFREDSIQWMADNYEALLTNIIENPHLPLKKYEITTEDRKQKLLAQSGGILTDREPGSHIHEWFEFYAEKCPASPALVFRGNELSYGELNEKANQFARYLRHRGLDSGDFVGLCVRRSMSMFVAILGILKSGCAYVAMDPNLPKSRLIDILKDSKPCLLVVDEATCFDGSLHDVYLDAELKETLPELVCIDSVEVENDLIQQSGENLIVEEIGLTPSSPAYVIYTSGSTGKPKGVVVVHKGMCNLAICQVNEFGLGGDQKVLQFSSASFDASVFEWMAALCHGGELYLISQDMVYSTSQLSTYIKDNSINFLTLVPSVLKELPVSCFKNDSIVLSVAEKFNPTLRETLSKRCKLYNGYGPTENTCAFTITKILPAGNISIGKPLPNMQAYVVDQSLNLLPPGVPGELLIGGESLAQGYLNRPELTAERFISNPFLDHPQSQGYSSRVYRTGDRVRWLSDGTLEFLGRIDEQVKIRGFRIEPGEVESKLQALNEVRDALVMAREDQGHRYLAAYVLPDSNHIATGDNDGDLIALCRAHLKSSLPNYMVPAGWSVLSQWPLLPSGKINRQALPLPVRSLSQTTVYRAPQTEQARQLCAIWSSVLGLDQVGVDDNFFEIGGDSILSIQVVSQARQQGIYFDVRDLFEHQSIAQLCDVIREEHGSQIVTPQDAATGSIVLHPVQQLFFAEPDIQRHHFNQSILLSTPLDFSLDRLYQLISALYERHDALRLSFQSGPEGWKGEFQPLSDTLVKASCERVELDSAGAEMQDNLSEIYTRWQSSLSLSGPLLKAGYIDMGPEKEGQLLLAVHHLVIDGVSWRIVLNDLEQAYKQLQSGSPVALPPKTSGYGQWCERLRAHSDSEELGRERAYWQGHSGSGESWLPLLDSAPETLPVHGELGAVTISLSEAETQCLLRDCGQAYRTQVQDLLVTGLYLALREWSGESCIELDLEGHGREALFSDLDISDTVGWFTSMYPQRLTFSLDMSLGQLIKAVKEQLRAIPDHGIGYGMLRYLSTKGVEGTGHHSPLVFNYLGQFGQSREESERSLSVLPGFRGKEISDERPVLHPLALNGQVSDGKLHFTLSYSRSHISQASAEQLSECLQNQWKAVIVHCSDPQSGGYTPVDFPLVDLDQAEVDVLEEAYSKLENVYYATPMQSGMLFHSLLEQGSGLYATQLGMDLDELNVDAFKEAWTVVLSRHEALRACFSGMESERLRQIIVSSAPLSWHEQDWSGLNEADQSDRYQTYLQYDLATPFDFSQPPLMRFALFKLDDGKYRFLWTCHHTLIDGWSNPLVWQTLSESYAAKLEMRPPELPAAGHYGQYIKWLSQQDMDKAQRYWQALVSDVEGPLKLGIELPQERVGQSSTYEIREENLQLTEQETAALRELSHRTHTTLNTVFLGAWSYLLHRYSGDERVLFGTTVSGRPAELSDVESMVGLFINTLPLRVNVSQEESVWLWLQSLQSQQVERSRYEYLGLSDIQKLSAVNSGESLFDSVVIYENYPSLSPSSNTSTSATLSARVVGSHESTNYGLTAVVVPQKQLSIKLQYQTDRFSREAMARLRDHLRELLLSLGSANSDTQLKDLSLLTPAERDTLLTGFNETEVDYQRNVCVPELIEEQARKEPDRTALVFEDSSLSYGELNTRANQVAHYLLSRGLKREEIVGLCHERGFDLLVSMLGILKAGGAYVPLDPGYPSRRLAGMLEDSGARWVLSDSEVLSGTPDLLSDIRAGSIGLLEMEFIEVDRQPYRDAIGGSEQSNPVLSERSSSDLAYVIYTSGSTGRPKGVMIEHQGLINLANYQHLALGVDENCRFLQFSSFNFDGAVFEWLAALTHGGQLHLIRREMMLSPMDLSDYIRTYQLTHFNLVPSILQEMPVETFSSSCYLFSVGEALTETLRERYAEHCHFYNGYGPTESTVSFSYWKISIDGKISVGKPLHNTQGYVVDRAMQLVPVGVPGELLIGGDGLARGYLNQSELTQERFIANPFRDDPRCQDHSSRVYRSGDMVRWLEDGSLEFLGRVDHQIKIRGNRVELGEIESCLQSLAVVGNALVLTREYEGHMQLVGYVSQEESSGLSEKELIVQCRDGVSDVLPDYMVPVAWVVVYQWPLLPSGKVDQKALAELNLAHQIKNEYIAPQSDMERMLCEIWQEVLGVERVGITDNFFHLGGDSIRSVQLVSRAIKLGVQIEVRDIFECYTIRDICKNIKTGCQKVVETTESGDSELTSKTAISEIESQFTAIEDIFSATPMQAGMLFHDLLDENGGLYITQITYDFRALSVKCFKKAWHQTVLRHEALRTAFIFTNEESLQQVIVKDFELEWQEDDCTCLTIDEREMLFQRRLEEEKRKGFDYSKPPLMRFNLFHLGDGCYRFLWTCHHALFDAWSSSIIWSDLKEIYEALLRNCNDSLNASVGFSQYLKWLSRQDFGRAQEYWTEQLAWVESPMRLGIELTENECNPADIIEVEMELSQSETQSLRHLAQQTNTTLSNVFLGAWAYLLHCYSGDEQVLFGSTVSGRPSSLSDVEKIVGLFINTVPIGVAIEDRSVNLFTWLQSIQSSQIDREAFSYMSLSEIQSFSNVKCEAGESLFDTVLIYENATVSNNHRTHTSSFSLTGEFVKSTGVTNYGLAVVIVPEETTSILIQYQTDRFSREAMARLRDHLRELLLSLGSANSDTQLKDLSLLTPAERDTLLTGFNETEVDYQRNVCVPELIEEQARKEPDRTALVFEDSSLSYGELNTRANQVAHYLLSRGLKREEIVGLCHERGFDLLVSMLGILKAGGAYVPLDPGYPSRRLAGMLEDSGARWVLSDSEVLSGTPDLLSDIRAGSIGLLEMEFIEVDRQPYRDAIGGSEQSNPVLSERSSSDLAYVIYTSGSTGRPKGVMIEHHSLVNFLFSSVERLSLDQYTVCLALTTISFDIAYLELFGPLLKGGQVVLMAEEDKLNIDVFSTVLTDSDVNLIQATPTYWSWVLEHRLEMPESMTVLCGGEAISKQLSDKLVGSFGGYYNCYGPTEATIWSLINYIDPDKDRAILGNAVSNLQHYVVDRWNEPVPVGVPGELLIGGEGLSRGYLNRDELTGEKFIANPFSEGASSRVYRTGDLVRWLSDGNLEFLGRLDHQVKIRGYRVELEEIETVLSRVEGVKDSLVMARSDEGHQQLVAYILNDLPAEEESELIRQCREKLQEQLPDFMVPSGWVVVTQWPLLPNGKINRAALPEVDVSKPKLTKGYQAPKTEQEKRLCELWSQVLQVERVGVTDNFFELGGDSLLAAKIVVHARDKFNYDFTLKEFFSEATVAGLVANKYVRTGNFNLPELAVYKGEKPRLSYSQRRLFFINKLEGPSAVHNIPVVMDISGEIDALLLREAIDEIVDRHQVLRTVFVEDGDEIYQKFVQRNKTVVELCETQDSQKDYLSLVIEEEVNKVFSLEKDIKLRAKIIKENASKCILVVTMHHVVADGLSVSVFLNELNAVYSSKVNNCKCTLSELSIQYCDYAEWQRSWLDNNLIDGEIEYWKAKLANISELNTLPSDFPRRANNDSSGSVVNYALPQDLCDALRQLSKEYNVTFFAMLQTAFSVLISIWSGTEDVVMGTTVSGRNEKNLESLIGVFINNLVLRTDVSNNPSFKDLLNKNSKHIIEAFDHQYLPFEFIVEALNPERSLAYNPLFQIMFIMQKIEGNVDLSGADVRFTRYGEHRVSEYDLTLNLTDTEKEVIVAYEYSTSLFKKESIQSFARCFEVLLREITRKPTMPIASYSILTDEDKTQLHNMLSLDEYIYSEEEMLFVHEMFERSVDSCPEKTALVIGDQRISYQLLEEKANRLARYLISQGVSEGECIGLYLDRSYNQIVGVLGVLKAGCAFLPLDVDSPKKRINHILSDSGIRTLITTTKYIEKISEIDLAGIVALDEPNVEGAIQNCSSKPLSTDINKSDLAYVIYTSGSTGVPKGVMVGHNAIIPHIYAVAEQYDIEPQDQIFQLNSFVFDAFFEQLFVSFMVGGTFYMPVSGKIDTDLIIETMQTHQITVIDIPTALCRELMSVNSLSKAFSDLKCLIVGGEKLSPTILEQWSLLKESNRPVLINAYGPTETVITACFHVVEPINNVVSIPIGRVLGNRLAYVVNESMNLVPPGVPGELLIGGESLAQGYLNRPELTAERFIPNPFLDHPQSQGYSSRVYRTGDRVRWLSDGTLEFLGRIDEQVKIRGFRIEPGEVESKLQALNEVRDALVMAREDQGHRYLAAYVLPDSNHIATGDNDGDLIALCRAHLKSSLPNYMVPAGWSVLSQWPLLPSGKINRQALPLPVRSLSQTTVYRAPQTEQARQLCAIWSSVLGLDQVGVDDNFFEIGGDSILSIQVVSQARQQGIYFDVRDLFEHQSIAQLCDVIREEHGSQIVTPQDAATGSIVLHPVQQLFFAEPDIQRHHFNQSILLSTPLDFSLDRLYQLISALYERHDALRLSFQSGPEGWKGEFQPLSDTLVKASCERVELDSAGAEMQDNLSEIYTRWQSSLSLSGPLLKAGYIDMGPEKEGQLLLAVHHLVIDGVSWRIVLNDLEQAYKQLQSGSPVALPPKTSGYGQWCERLRAHSDSEELGRERAYWQGHSGSGESWLPLLDSAPETLPVHGELGAVTISLSEAETQCLLRDCGQAYRTQVQDLLVTGLYLALREWSGESCIELDLEGHGREALFSDLDISDTVGWFTSMYPQRLTFSLDMSLGQLIKAVKEQLRAIPDHGIGYGMLRYLSTKGVEGTGHHSPLVFNYLGQFGQSREESERSLSVLPGFRGKEISDERPVLHPLALNGQVSDGKLHFTLSYSRSHISQASAEQLSECLQNQWKAVIVHCSDPQSGGYTPVDFPLVDLDQAEVDVLEEAYSKLENVYYATPMQSGMLFHSLLEQGSGLYATQLGMDLDELNVDAFKEAWTVVLSRHEALRACFSGMESERLRQIIVSSAPLSWHEQDWSGLNEADQSDRYQTYLQYDLATPFDFSQPPLMRFALFKLDDGKYRFLWTCHHTLIDGWSNPLVWQTLSESYAAKLEMRPPELPAAGHYGQYIKWLSQQDMDKAQRYWQALVSDVEGPLKLGIELPQERVGQSSTYEIREENLQLTEQETAALRELSHRTHTTLNTVFLGAWSYLLHRYSGDERVLFGTTVSGRPAELSDVESMVGLFINTLPLRVNVSQEESVWLWLQSLQSQQVERSRYEYLGLSDIQKLSAVNSGESLFDSVVIYENYPSLSPSSNTSTSATLSARVVGSHESTNYGLTAVVVPQKQLSIKLQYQTDRFSREAMARLRDHLRELLLSLGSANSDTQLKDLSLLTPAERDTLLTGFNETEVDYQRNVCVPELIEEQARKEPDRTALVFEDSSLSYGELNTRANQVAHYLLSRGLKREEIVGLCHERGFDLLVSMLGILKAGGAYVPLDPGYPSRRLAGMLEDSGARWVLSDSEVLSGTPDLLSDIRAGSIGLLEMEFIEVDRQPYRDAIGGSEQSNPVLSERSSSDLAYVIYTSGSTGRPKGVMIEHQGLINLANYQHLALGVDENCRFLQFSSFNFDGAVFEWLAALTHGGQLHLIRREMMLSPMDLSDYIRTYQLTHFNLVPSILQEMPVETFSSSCYLFSVGEALTETLRERYAEHCHFYNGYGPTESTVSFSYWKISIDGKISVGKPLHNTQGYVVDRAMQLVPVGVPGELLIGGDGLARGYLNQSELTQERFIANPFRDDPRCQDHSSRVYRSGDMVRWLEDGSLEFLGRVDHQIKIRGNRVELGEIESCLQSLAVVGNALVLTREYEGHMQLVGYVSQEESSGLSEKELIVQCRDGVSDVLPDYMVPVAWVVVYQWPLLPSGKVDQKALAELNLAHQIKNEYIAPQSDMERMLCEIWQEVLGVERVGITDNFFHLGGDSLKFIQMKAILKDKVGITLKLKKMMELPTINKLRLELEDNLNAESTIEPVSTGRKGSSIQFRAGNGEYIPEAAIDMLLGNPESAQDFDAAFDKPGLASHVLKTLQPDMES
uniref:Amino acid adenylation domain n=1 Tax=Marinomonas sp. (strain MWYL1) TaxID=400668 RepID=A6VYG2_MARMS